MDSLTGDIEAAYEEALARLEPKLRPHDCAGIRQVISANLQTGRHTYYFSIHPQHTPAHYVEHVAEFYLHLSPYLHQVQVEKLDAVWVDLFEQLKKWCLRYLTKKGWPYNQETGETAQGYAAEAGAALLRARFPYDTDFTPWAVTVAHNVCRKHLRDSSRRPPTPKEALSLEDETSLKLESKLHTSLDETVETRQDLLAAIQQLKQQHQQVLYLYYFENLTPLEISARLAMPQSTVYRLKFDAIKELRKILVQNGYK